MSEESDRITEALEESETELKNKKWALDHEEDNEKIVALKTEIKELNNRIKDYKKQLKELARKKEIDEYDPELFKEKIGLAHRRHADAQIAYERTDDRAEKVRLKEEMDELEAEITGLKDRHNDIGVAAGHEEFDAEAEAALKKKVLGEARKGAGIDAGSKAKAAAGATIAGLGAAGRGAKKAYNAMNDPFMKAQRTVGKKIGGAASTLHGAVEHVHPELFAIVLLFIHAYDVVNGFSRGGGQLAVMIFLYFLVALYASLFFYRTEFSSESGKYYGLSALAVVLPLILHLPYISKMSYLPVVLTLCPVWFLYVALNETESKWLHLTGKLLIIFLIICFLLILLMTFSMPDLFARGVNLGVPFKTFWGDVTDGAGQMRERIAAHGFFNIAAWRQKINQTFNPYAKYYTGQVEENKAEPQGVYITRVESLHEEYYPGDNAEVFARLEAKSFLPETLYVVPSCRLERAGKEFATGTPDPVEPIAINYNLVRDVSCTYALPENPNVTRTGTYEAVVGAAFTFETWSYVTDTFVSRDLIESYARDGKDVNRELDIPKETEAIYTNGPVMVGVSADQQPIDIDLSAAPGKYVQQRFGFTIDNHWEQGKLREVTKATVLVPEPFQLDDCSPTRPTSKTPLEGKQMTQYVFERSADLSLRDEYDYRTVTCKLVLPTEQDAKRVLSFGEKVPVTFVVIADYDYVVEESTRLQVGT